MKKEERELEKYIDDQVKKQEVEIQFLVLALEDVHRGARWGIPEKRTLNGVDLDYLDKIGNDFSFRVSEIQNSPRFLIELGTHNDVATLYNKVFGGETGAILTEDYSESIKKNDADLRDFFSSPSKVKKVVEKGLLGVYSSNKDPYTTFQGARVPAVRCTFSELKSYLAEYGFKKVKVETVSGFQDIFSVVQDDVIFHEGDGHNALVMTIKIEG